MGNIKRHIDSTYRNREIVRLCKNLFYSIDSHGLIPELRKEVEWDMECWNNNYYEGVSIEQVKEFILQVVECVFGEDRNTKPTQPLDLETNKVSEGEDHEPIRNNP